MRIEVFAETSSTAEKIAEFYDEEIYNMCFSKLEAWAKENGWQMITERVLDAEETD
jgi:hypothetical protein|tara:strand:- start:1495 stop:1662 length:168 start_codon:yes stop_codon:yes gene_type:complete